MRKDFTKDNFTLVIYNVPHNVFYPNSQNGFSPPFKMATRAKKINIFFL